MNSFTCKENRTPSYYGKTCFKIPEKMITLSFLTSLSERGDGCRI